MVVIVERTESCERERRLDSACINGLLCLVRDVKMLTRRFVRENISCVGNQLLIVQTLVQISANCSLQLVNFHLAKNNVTYSTRLSVKYQVISVV